MIVLDEENLGWNKKTTLQVFSTTTKRVLGLRPFIFITSDLITHVERDEMLTSFAGGGLRGLLLFLVTVEDESLTLGGVKGEE